MAAAFTKGVQKEGIGVSIKHFAANNQETNRTQVNTIVSERAMREIYLKGFEIAVKEADPWTVMSSYNKINDVYTSERKDLLTNILRDEWGFKGFVMTDWFGGKNTVEQVKAGNDMLMPGSQQQQTDIINAIKDGSLSMADLDRNVARILTVYFKTQSYNNYKPSGVPQLQVNKGVSQQAAEEGMVLLRNEKQTLPIQPNTSEIALYGIASYRTISGGTGSGDVNKAYSVSIADGLKKAGYTINSSLEKIFNTYIDVQKSQQKPKKVFFLPDEVIEELDCTEAQLDEDAAKCAVGIFTISRSSGEFFDRKEDNDFNLKKNELQFIQKLSTAFHKQHKPVIILLNIGGVIETSSWKNLADAILLVWQPGQEAGNAVANILSGKVNPSGKLPTTFPVKYSDVYSSKNFPGRQLDSSQAPNVFTGVPSEVIYEEDIFVGYRYFETLHVTPSYSFGYGLSYSTFAFSDMQVEQTADGNFTVSCNVTNTGKVDGKEVVQLYISAPDGKLKKPAKELKAFAKTKLLKPGEKQSFSFTLTPYDISSFDSDKSEWILEKGKYTFSIGSSIADVTLSQSITKTETVSVLKTSKSLTPTRVINGLK
jgi:beta-glucosidase